MTKQMGSNAGKIWQKLEGDLTDTNIEKIRKECELSASEFFLALGWLAREDKIHFHDGKKKVYIFPKN